MNNLNNTISLDDLLLGIKPSNPISATTFKDPSIPRMDQLLNGETLTIKHLLNWDPCVFSFGESFLSVYEEHVRIRFKWIAKTGVVGDWAIYMGDLNWTYDYILRMGKKIYKSEIIKEIVDCDYESFQMYRS